MGGKPRNRGQTKRSPFFGEWKLVNVPSVHSYSEADPATNFPRNSRILVAGFQIRHEPQGTARIGDLDHRQLAIVPLRSYMILVYPAEGSYPYFPKPVLSASASRPETTITEVWAEENCASKSGLSAPTRKIASSTRFGKTVCPLWCMGAQSTFLANWICSFEAPKGGGS